MSLARAPTAYVCAGQPGTRSCPSLNPLWHHSFVAFRERRRIIKGSMLNTSLPSPAQTAKRTLSPVPRLSLRSKVQARRDDSAGRKLHVLVGADFYACGVMMSPVIGSTCGRTSAKIVDGDRPSPTYRSARHHNWFPKNRPFQLRPVRATVVLLHGSSVTRSLLEGQVRDSRISSFAPHQNGQGSVEPRTG